jgi:phosphoribosyl-ATP pyrophosphohydrolase/phosphoribosyl-AMP cyclohydrolase
MNPDFSKSPDGLIPAIIQDHETGDVLMLGFMNEEAFYKTKSEGRVSFFSRSRQRIWTKGETSGNHLLVKDISLDCDNDTFLIIAIPSGPVCHTGSQTCFENKKQTFSLDKLTSIIHDRKINPLAGSYTSELFHKGINKISQKVGEEAIELIIESKDENKDLFINEAADLLYHFLILLEAKNTGIRDVLATLAERNEKKQD